MPTASARTAWRARDLALLGAGVVLVAGHAVAHLADLPGQSHDGENLGVWLAGARALLAHPAASRLGMRAPGLRPAPGIYAHHPGLILPALAIAHVAGGGAWWAYRAVPLVATVVAMVATWMVATRRGVDGTAASLGVLVGFGCPMVATYGAMADTWIVGLAPAMVLLAVLAHPEPRAGRGRRATVAAAAALTVGTSWLGWLLWLALLARVAARRRRPDTTSLALAAGGSGAALATGTWLVWGAGGVRSLGQVLSTRTSAPGAPSGSWHAFVSQVAGHLVELHRPAGLILGAVGIVVALRTPLRSDLLCLGGAVVVWTVAFHEGAAVHSYWTFWAVAVVALAMGGALDALATRVGASARTTIAAVVLAAALAALGILVPSGTEVATGGAEAAGRAVAAVDWGIQSTAWIVGVPGDTGAWAAAIADRPVVFIATRALVLRLAADHGADEALVALSPARPGAPCLTRLAHSQFGATTAARLPALLVDGGVAACA